MFCYISYWVSIHIKAIFCKDLLCGGGILPSADPWKLCSPTVKPTLS